MTQNNLRVALYIGNSLYPDLSSDPDATIQTLQKSPLTSPILGLVNQSGSNPDQLVYNDAVNPANPIFDSSGKYIGSSDWKGVVSSLKSGGNIREAYLSFSTTGTQYMADLIGKNSAAAQAILESIKNDLGFDGIDLDYEDSDLQPGSPIYVVGKLAAEVGLSLTAAPYFGKDAWKSWVSDIQSCGGTVAWLNLQCYAGGKYNNPGDWLDITAPIVPGCCSDCSSPHTVCSPADMQDAFTLWRTGNGSVSPNCWQGTPNRQPLGIGGGFIWVYSSIESNYDAYVNAVAAGLGI